jgi:ABC-type branched-subunit amino acid transport system substrate-binding protein
MTTENVAVLSTHAADLNRETQRERARRIVVTPSRHRHSVSAISLSVLAIGLVACSTQGSTSPTTSPGQVASSGASAGEGSPSPGVTPTSVTVGQVDDLSSPVPGPFISAEDGTKAYFAYVNSRGGINGRKLILDAQDSTFQGGVVATDTGSQIRNDFALVGGFSILDSAEKPLIDIAHMPDITLPLDPDMVSDPYVYSPLPNAIDDVPLGIFKYLKHRYSQAVRKVGIIWENATPATVATEHAFEAAMKSVGFGILYDHGVGPFDTDFLPDIIHMEHAGVEMFVGLELPDSFAATLAKQMQQQNFKPINIEGTAYSAQLLALAGSAADKMYIYQSYALYLGQDAMSVPAVKLFVQWVNKVDSHAAFAIESVYGWTSAELFADALKQAGDPPTRARLIMALDKMTSFDSGGLIPPSDPAQNIPSNCFLLAQVQHGHIERVPPTPPTGFYCPSDGYLPAPGYQRIVRPTS